MALVPIIQQSWDTNSYFTPTRMNNIENNIAILSNATGVKYSNDVSVKDKIDEIRNKSLFDTSRVIQGEYTVPANAYVNLTISLPTKTGFTPVGVVQYELNTARAYMVYSKIENNQLTVTMATLSSSAVNVNASAFVVLYVRNNLN